MYTVNIKNAEDIKLCTRLVKKKSVESVAKDLVLMNKRGRQCTTALRKIQERRIEARFFDPQNIVAI